MEDNDNVIKAREAYRNLYASQSLYIRQEKSKFWVTRRTFASVEVEWDWLFPVTVDEAQEIVDNHYAVWHWTVKPYSIR